MSRKKRHNGAQQPVRTADGYNNFTAKLGTNTQNIQTGGTYVPGYITRNRVMLEFAYRSSFLVGAGVDSMADDMTRKGISISSKLEPGQKGKVETFWDDFAIWDGVNDVLKWSRLYGGAILVMLIDGQDNKERTVSEIAQQVGLVLQVPGNQMSGVRFTVFEEVAFGLENRGVPRTEIQERVNAVLPLIGLENFASCSPFELSGGQQQRLALATVLAVDPPVIILDEPTTFLDPQGAELVFEILRQLQQKGKTIVIAEQRLDLIAQYASRVLAFDKGHLVMDGVPRAVLTSSAMDNIQLNWTRFTQVAHLARQKGLLPADTPLPASLKETVDTFTEQKEGYAHSG